MWGVSAREEEYYSLEAFGQHFSKREKCAFLGKEEKLLGPKCCLILRSLQHAHRNNTKCCHIVLLIADWSNVWFVISNGKLLIFIPNMFTYTKSMHVRVYLLNYFQISWNNNMQKIYNREGEGKWLFLWSDQFKRWRRLISRWSTESLAVKAAKLFRIRKGKYGRCSLVAVLYIHTPA